MLWHHLRALFMWRRVLCIMRLLIRSLSMRNPFISSASFIVIRLIMIVSRSE